MFFYPNNNIKNVYSIIRSAGNNIKSASSIIKSAGDNIESPGNNIKSTSDIIKSVSNIVKSAGGIMITNDHSINCVGIYVDILPNCNIMAPAEMNWL